MSRFPPPFEPPQEEALNLKFLAIGVAQATLYDVVRLQLNWGASRSLAYRSILLSAVGSRHNQITLAEAIARDRLTRLLARNSLEVYL